MRSGRSSTLRSAKRHRSRASFSRGAASRPRAGERFGGKLATSLTNATDTAPGADEKQPTGEELSALARFRFALRRFLNFSEQAAADLGLTMQWYQALLVIKTYPTHDHISVGELAEQLMIRDHSAAELVSRLVHAKLVRRKTDPSDRRRSLLIVTSIGRPMPGATGVGASRETEGKQGRIPESLQFRGGVRLLLDPSEAPRLFRIDSRLDLRRRRFLTARPPICGVLRR